MGAGAIVLTIGGAVKEMLFGWTIQETTNGRNNFTCDVASVPGTYRPALDDEIILTLAGTRIFGGDLQTPTESGLTDGGTPIQTAINAIDFNALVDRRQNVNETIAAGSLKAALTVLVTYLTPYGVSLDAAQATGPTLPALVFARQKLGDVLNQLASLTAYVWEIDYNKVLRMIAVGSVNAPFNIVNNHTYGDVEVSSSRANPGTPYANRVIVVAGTPDVPIVAQSDDLTQQGLHGLWEIVISAPTVFDLPTAQALSDALLATSTPTPRTVTYYTDDDGLHPGQVQSILMTWRNINNTFLITQVEATSYENNVRYKVTALEGSIYQPGWREQYQQWFGSSSQISIVPGTAGAGRAAYYLGGSAIESVQAPGSPAWIPIDGLTADPGMQVTLDTVSRGSASARVTVRLRARSGDLQARLRNVSDNVVVGTSASVVAPTTFQSASFSVTLTPGSKLYQLEILPTVADSDVAGIGYLE